MARLGHVPSRLFVCLGLDWPLTCAADLRWCFAAVDFFLEEALTVTLALGEGAGFVTGDRRKADGDGMVIVAIELSKGFKDSDQNNAALHRP